MKRSIRAALGWIAAVAVLLAAAYMIVNENRTPIGAEPASGYTH